MCYETCFPPPNRKVNEAGPGGKRLEAARRVRTCLTEESECLGLTGLNLSGIPAVIIGFAELRTLHFEAASLEHCFLPTDSLSYCFPKLEKLLADRSKATRARFL